MDEGRSKSSKPQPERRANAEHFCCDHTLAFLIKLEKLIQIYVLISVQVKIETRQDYLHFT